MLSITRSPASGAFAASGHVPSVSESDDPSDTTHRVVDDPPWRGRAGWQCAHPMSDPPGGGASATREWGPMPLNIELVAIDREPGPS